MQIAAAGFLRSSRWDQVWYARYGHSKWVVHAMGLELSLLVAPAERHEDYLTGIRHYMTEMGLNPNSAEVVISRADETISFGDRQSDSLSPSVRESGGADWDRSGRGDYALI